MTDCIRRDYAIWTTCRCDNCATDRRRTMKRYQCGLIERTPSSHAWERINEWTDAGYTPTWIASAAGIPQRGIQSALEEQRITGHQRDFGHTYATAITNTDITNATAGRRDATGTRRRLQALAINGWTCEAIAAQSGLSIVTLAHLQRGAGTLVHARIWRGVRDLYQRIENTPGDSQPATTRAHKLGYLPAAQWDDPDTDPEPAKPERRRDTPIDDVAIERHLLGDKTPRLTHAERVETLRRWIARDLGSLLEFTRRTGITRPHRYMNEANREMDAA